MTSLTDTALDRRGQVSLAGHEESGLTAALTSWRFNVDGIPAEFKSLDRWVTFKLERDARGKLKKTPRIPGTDAEASNSNPAHWRSLDIAVADALARYQYIGFVFDRSLPYVFIDLDSVIGAGGAMRASAARVVDTLRAPTERSASGSGLHIFCGGSLPEWPEIVPDLRPIEIYPLRGPRFCVMTGDLIPVEGNLSGTLPDRSAELAALFPPRPLREQNGRTAGYRGPRGELTQGECDRIVEWAQQFWSDGRRHHMALYLSGYLGKQGISRAQAVAIIDRCASGDSDPAAKISACHDTYDDLDARCDVSGWCGLIDIGISDEELASLAAILHRFWRRTRPRMLRNHRLRVCQTQLHLREVNCV